MNNISTGDRLRRARERRRLSRRQLAEILHIDPKTIARIERDQVHRSPNIGRLEEYLREDQVVEQEPGGGPTDPGPTLAEAADLELVAELARRLASRREGGDPTHEARGYFTWSDTDLPHPEQGGPATTSKRKVADGRSGE